MFFEYVVGIGEFGSYEIEVVGYDWIFILYCKG